MKRSLLIVSVAAILSGCATATVPSAGTPVSPRTAQDALALTPDHFRQTAEIEDDSLDVTANINTRLGMAKKQGLLGIVWDDNFLRAIVDKKTGATVFQVYQWINYTGDWRFYNTVNFETPDGPSQASLTRISQDVLSCSGSRYGGCTHSEHFAFTVDEALLRTIAAGYRPGQEAVWRFKYGASQAEDWQDGLLPAEVAGFLQAVDAYREGKGFTVTPAAGL